MYAGNFKIKIASKLTFLIFDKNILIKILNLLSLPGSLVGTNF